MPGSRRRLRRFAMAALPLLCLGLVPVSVHAGEEPEWGNFGIQTRWMDEAVHPGDDFDAYVNGRWNATTTMPADKSRIGAFITLRDLSEERLKAILDELLTSELEAGSDEARIADAYSAFMDTDAIEAAGLDPARPWLERIYAAHTVHDLAALFAEPGLASPVGIWVNADAKQSDVNAVYLAQSGLGLPDRSYYLEDSEKKRETRARYKEYLAFLLGQLAYADPSAAAEAVYSLELRMAQEMWDRAVQRNRDLTYNRIDRETLDSLDETGVMAALLASAGVPDGEGAIAMQMPPTGPELAAAGIGAAEAGAKIGGGLPATMKLVADVPVATWQAWLAARFLSDHAAVLPAEIDAARFAFYGTVLSGQPEQRERWKRGVDAVEEQLGELLGRLYAQRHYPPEERAEMERLVANLRRAMAANLEELAWMGPETRARAREKLDAFTPKIGTPDKYKTYAGLTPSPDDALANAMAAHRWQLDDMLSRLGKPVDRSEWYMFPHTVNAYYNPLFNEIVFPAAILQPPFFNLSADPAVNYGAIGAVIGHEIGHGFDDQGAKSDGQGNLRNWWTDEDKANFKALQDRLVEQYNGFCPFDDGKTCVNGRLSLGENIGDVGGLSLAYRAYRLSLDDKEAPVIDGFTGDQRFFMSWAQVWRSMMREEAARQQLLTGPHSPPRYRVNGVVRNFDEWYAAFGVSPDHALYLAPGKRVRIW